MGNCILGSGGRQSHDGDSSHSPTLPPVHIKTQPLKGEPHKWKSEAPMSAAQLRRKRDDFWETSPIFEGRKEVWDALRAAASAAESNDLSLAQALLNGASITTPDGTLLESYDQLGNRYIVPMYCLSEPSNLIEDDTEEPPSPPDPHLSNSDNIGIGFGDCKIHLLRLRVNARGEERELKFRSGDTIAAAKCRLARDHPGKRQRWYYGGAILDDKSQIKDLNIPQGHIIQVVFNE